MAIVKLPSGNFQVKVQLQDGSWVCETFQRKRDAETCNAKVKAEKRRGNLGVYGYQITLGDFFDEWYEWAKTTATPAWRVQQKVMFEKHIEPNLGERTLAEIRTADIAQLLTNMSERGFSPAMSNHVFTFLRKLYNDAAEVFDIIVKNPVKRNLKQRLPVRESKYLNASEAAKLLATCRNDPYGLPIWLGLFLGLRIGEIQALRWSDVDLVEGVMHIRRAYSKHDRVFRDYPKGKRHHSKTIPIELLELLREAQVTATGELVVMPPKWNMLDYWDFRRQLLARCEQAGVQPITAHGLRHSSTELYIAHGATKDDLQRLLAHTSVATTERYIHDKGTQLEKVAKVIRLFPETKSSTFLPRQRISVAHILECLAGGMTFQEIAEDYGVPPECFPEAMKYAASLAGDPERVAS
jgi:integrase